MLDTTAMPPGRRLVTFDQVPSTNSEAMRLAASGDAGGVWLVAGEQTQGRGRSGRVWTSTSGNLYASLMLRLSCGPETAQQLALLAGVAVVNAVRAVSDILSDTLGTNVTEASDQRSDTLRLKWPNDVLIGSAKLGGILVECAQNLGGPGLVAAIGVGLNVAGVPDGLGRAATSLATAGIRTDRDTLLAALAVAVDSALTIWDEGAGFQDIRAAWLVRAGPIGEALVVNIGSGPVAGCYSGLDHDGALLLAEGQGPMRRFTYGDVTLAASAGEQ